MIRVGVVFMMLAAVLLMAGCSDKKKEAARLEQEMMDREATADSIAEQLAIDSAADTSDVADAAAVPAEDEQNAAPMPPAPEGDGFTVQVASCEDEDYARYLVELYQKRGYEPFVSTVTYDNQQYYRVRIGKFEGMSEAKGLQSELADKYSLSPWVDYLNK